MRHLGELLQLHPRSALLPHEGRKVRPMYPLHPPAGKHTSMAVNAGMLPATLGAQAAHVAAGGGMLQHVRRCVSVQVRMQPKGMASA